MIKSSRRSRPFRLLSANPPANSPPSLDVRIEKHQIVITQDDRPCRVRGLEQNQSPWRLNVRIMASRADLAYLDTPPSNDSRQHPALCGERPWLLS
jgi:hypothetical protein